MNKRRALFCEFVQVPATSVCSFLQFLHYDAVQPAGSYPTGRCGKPSGLDHHLLLLARDKFTTAFLHFSLFSTALWDLANSSPVRSLMLSSHLFLCLPHLLSPFNVPCEMVLARPDEQETCPYHFSLDPFSMACILLCSSTMWKVTNSLSLGT